MSKIEKVINKQTNSVKEDIFRRSENRSLHNKEMFLIRIHFKNLLRIIVKNNYYHKLSLKKRAKPKKLLDHQF